MSPPASGVMGDAWNQQGLCKLQSAPIALLNGSDALPGSSNNALLLYAALQDKSIHKYRLNLPALLMPSKTKVPSAHHQCITCCIVRKAVYLGSLLFIENCVLIHTAFLLEDALCCKTSSCSSLQQKLCYRAFSPLSGSVVPHIVTHCHQQLF